MNGRFPYPVLCCKLPHCRTALRVGRPNSLGLLLCELGAGSSAYWILPLWRAVPRDRGEKDTPASVADGTTRYAVLYGQLSGSDGTAPASLADFCDKCGGQCLHVFLFSEGRLVLCRKGLGFVHRPSGRGTPTRRHHPHIVHKRVAPSRCRISCLS